ncbi:thiol reductant ABC exporter subunit CydD [Variovorax sp. PAMC26660]|uniref:thiol reductant ABC exporter subunit CydD n=1 Tax=Variovorax sp. PAMC26660 TaxID=2762322 RepID=UPI00164E824A|nr:thiol reductant ABC exporter subunit CydD [Variovorax sp. PAMC26660]QNK66295.1 thiol reductant ABC exporter subunit CydD [Variovorax sp. PAMC26660]
MTKHSPPRSPLRAVASPDIGSVVQGAAALLWLPQAALLAMAVQGLASGRGMAAVLWPAGAILVLGLLRAGCEAWGARRTFGRARAQLSALRAQTVAALAAGSPMDRGRAPSGQAASVLAEQGEALVPYLVRYQPARWRVMVVPIFILCAVVSLSWVAALVLLFAAPLIPIFMAIVGWRAKAASEAQMVEMGGMNAFLLDRLRGLATLRALDAVDATAQRLGDAAQSLRRRTMAVLRIAFLSSAVLELFSALGVAMVAAYVGFYLLGSLSFGAWGRQLSLGEGLFILLLAPAFFEPLRELSAVWHDRAAGEAALQALDQLQRNELPLPGANASVTRAATGVASSGSAPAITVHGLHFSWPGESQEVFDGYELRIAPGEHIALTGPSGSGKTALLSLIAGLVPAASGDISIGGVTLTDHTVAALRQRMAWMGQAPHVFAGSVETNVVLGRTGIDTQQVAAAMRFASLEDVAQARPGVTLGEGGNGLSGGEAVRLALARIAVHLHADLLLIDEPTAHLDTDTAERVADALMALARGKTLVVATHDPVLAARMDRVVNLGADTMEKAA